MKILSSTLIILLFSVRTLFGQLTSDVTSWVINSTGLTGYAGILSNVQKVQYSDNNVYISCTCIPGYSIGPWMGNPNIPINQNFVFKLTRKPIKNTGVAVAVGLGHTGVWSNGVSIFNADDAHTYNNKGVWHQNAYVFEGISFDDCLGHPAPGGEYHHHVNPRCLYSDTNDSIHSPIIGYAFDGFPIYGAYAFTKTDGTGAIKRMKSSYQLRNITNRTTLADGTVLTSDKYGPDLATKALGSYIQDYEYKAGSGDLDDHNGRFCVTPDYPNGIYAYFVTIDASLKPVYPYTLGPTYYGTVQAGNTGGPTGGHNTINEPVLSYPTVTSTAEINNQILYSLSPNPTSDFAYIYFDPSSMNNINGAIYNSKGQMMASYKNMQPSISYSFDLSSFPSGLYILKLESGNQHITQKIVKIK